MRKVPTLFRRDPENMRRLLREVHPDCQWVLDGEGIATRKYDGTCVMLDRNGTWWARREVKPDKLTPPGFVAVQHDDTTGKTVGWEPIEHSPFVKAWREIMGNPRIDKDDLTPGTYELVGPKINGNPERCAQHQLVPHGEWVLADAPLGFDELAEWLHAHDIEGIVWHRGNGDMAKLKRRDFLD